MSYKLMVRPEMPPKEIADPNHWADLVIFKAKAIGSSEMRELWWTDMKPHMEEAMLVAPTQATRARDAVLASYPHLKRV